MATGTIILPVLAFTPDATNPPGLGWTSTLNMPYLAFDGGSTDEVCTIQFRMPVDYASAPVLNVQWFGTSGTTSGNVVWGCQLLAITGNTDAGAVDSETYATANTQQDAHLGTTGDRLHDVAITISNTDSVVADDFVLLKFFRDASDTVNDTYAADANVLALSMEYTTS